MTMQNITTVMWGISGCAGIALALVLTLCGLDIGLAKVSNHFGRRWGSRAALNLGWKTAKCLIVATAISVAVSGAVTGGNALYTHFTSDTNLSSDAGAAGSESPDESGAATGSDATGSEDGTGDDGTYTLNEQDYLPDVRLLGEDGISKWEDYSKVWDQSTQPHMMDVRTTLASCYDAVTLPYGWFYNWFEDEAAKHAGTDPLAVKTQEEYAWVVNDNLTALYDARQEEMKELDEDDQIAVYEREFYTAVRTTPPLLKSLLEAFSDYEFIMANNSEWIEEGIAYIKTAYTVDENAAEDSPLGLEWFIHHEDPSKTDSDIIMTDEYLNYADLALYVLESAETVTLNPGEMSIKNWCLDPSLDDPRLVTTVLADYQENRAALEWNWWNKGSDVVLARIGSNMDDKRVEEFALSNKVVDPSNPTPSTEQKPVDYPLEIVYQYDNGTEADTPYRVRLAEGAQYYRVSKVIPNYVADKPIVYGDMPNHAVRIVVTYRPIQVNTPHNLHLVYRYSTGTIISDNNYTKYEGDPFRYVSDAIPGWTPDTWVIEGTMGSHDLEFIVTYYKDRTETPHNLHLVYKYETGTIISDNNYSLWKNDPFYYETPPIDGWTPDTWLVSGTMGNHDLEFIVTYYKNNTPPPDDEDGKDSSQSGVQNPENGNTQGSGVNANTGTGQGGQNPQTEERTDNQQQQQQNQDQQNQQNQQQQDAANNNGNSATHNDNENLGDDWTSDDAKQDTWTDNQNGNQSQAGNENVNNGVVVIEEGNNGNGAGAAKSSTGNEQQAEEAQQQNNQNQNNQNQNQNDGKGEQQNLNDARGEQQNLSREREQVQMQSVDVQAAAVAVQSVEQVAVQAAEVQVQAAEVAVQAEVQQVAVQSLADAHEEAAGEDTQPAAAAASDEESIEYVVVIIPDLVTEQVATGVVTID